MKLYDDPISGNGYKVRLVLNQLGKDYEYVPLDITRDETQTPAFLKINPNGKIPALVLDNGRALWESNAIIWYLAKDTPLIPSDPFAQAQVLQWMGFEQYSHEPKVAVARFIMLHTDENDPRRAEIPACIEGGKRALRVMESHLQANDFFVDNHYSIADVALYAYTHVAEDGGFDLGEFPAVQAWLARVAMQDGHVLISQT